MVPDSLAALVSFLLLLAPGIVWQLQRARYRPTVKESALIEVSRVVLASLAATGTAATLLSWWVWLPLYRYADTASDSSSPSPVASVPYLAGVVATSLLACGLVLFVSLAKWPGRAPINEGRIWSQAFIDLRPSNAKVTYLTVVLLDNTVWRGELLGFDSDPEDAQRSLLIGPPVRRKRDGGKEFDHLDDPWRMVILPESQIKSIQVFYLPTNSAAASTAQQPAGTVQPT
ncbi:hypothetical protein JN535_19080 [Cellulosimicrobium cellulans]|uniref:DUF6338 family protein n=1 Tax=Cellulosimicrobium cellulans TaxID=1710 RepID=UPI0019656CCC|nr:DUF6338 family protein [Cellulosimicrobium cellulans]MBN0042259.1 hypothetical protein [Cellulosimicrobium cellulans]